MHAQRIVLVAGAMLALACTSSKPEPAAPASAQGSAAAPPSTPSSAAPVTADPGPQLTRKTGALPVETLPAITAQAEAVQRDKGATYVEVGMPDDLATLPKGALGTARLVVQGERYALAVPAGEGRVADRPLALVRFTGTAPVADFEITWSQPSTLRQPGVQLTVKVQMGAATERGELDERFFEAASTWFRRRGAVGVRRDELFHVYAGARTARLANLKRPEQRRRPAQAARSEMAETMRLYTGLTSVDEALQHDRGLLINRGRASGPRVPLAQIKGIPLPGHPWAELIDAHPSGAQPRIEPLARYAPADAIYLFFHDLRTFVRLGDDVDDLLRPLGRALEERPGDRRLTQRYEQQLAVARLGLAKTLGHLAVKGVAVVAADPYLRDGTDLAVLFHVRNRTVLDQALSSYEVKTRARRPDLKAGTVTVAGKALRRLHTPDGDVNRIEVPLADDVFALTNSEAMAAQLVAVAAKTQPALADSGEYRYFRLDAPADPAQEAGFAFIGDALVGKVTGPAHKILQARRMAAQSELYALNYAALLYGWLEGKPPASARAMVDAGIVAASELKHADGTGRIEFDPQRGAWSKAWGRPSAMRPLSAHRITDASAHERAAYVRFAESYQRYWRGFIDPVGVRIIRSEDGKALSLDARMMPLIQSSDYNDLERMVGRTRMVPAAPVGGLRSVLAVGSDARLRATIDQLGRTFTNNRDVGLGWLGDWVMVGVADHSGLWDAALALGEIPGTEGKAEYASMDLRKKVMGRIPLYVGAHVKSPLALAATLGALKTLAASAAPGMVTWGPSGAHRGVEVVTVAETIDGDGLSLHYATAKDVFIAALDRGVLHGQIDAVLDGVVSRPAKRDDPAAAQATIALAPTSGRSWLVRTLFGLLERGTSNTNHAAALAFEALHVGRGGLPGEAEARARLALDWLGQVPVSPHGGTFSLDANGVVQHSIYGSALAPNRPELPVAGSRVTDFANALKGLEMSLSFFGSGNTRGLRSVVTWTRR